MRFSRGFAVGLLATVAFLACAPAFAVDGQTMIITGEDYTKWLWGTQRTDGSVYNFTTVPGEGYGENGQGTEIDLYLFSKPNKYVEVQGRLQSRFNQNEWTNYGGFGGTPASATTPCLGGSCGEFDPRSNQYIKLRGLTAPLHAGVQVAGQRHHRLLRPRHVRPPSRSVKSVTSTATTPARSCSRARCSTARSATT